MALILLELLKIQLCQKQTAIQRLKSAHQVAQFIFCPMHFAFALINQTNRISKIQMW